MMKSASLGISTVNLHCNPVGFYCPYKPNAVEGMPYHLYGPFYAQILVAEVLGPCSVVVSLMNESAPYPFFAAWAVYRSPDNVLNLVFIDKTNTTLPLASRHVRPIQIQLQGQYNGTVARLNSEATDSKTQIYWKGWKYDGLRSKSCRVFFFSFWFRYISPSFNFHVFYGRHPIFFSFFFFSFFSFSFPLSYSDFLCAQKVFFVISCPFFCSLNLFFG